MRKLPVLNMLLLFCDPQNPFLQCTRSVKLCRGTTWKKSPPSFLHTFLRTWLRADFLVPPEQKTCCDKGDTPGPAFSLSVMGPCVLKGFSSADYAPTTWSQPNLQPLEKRPGLCCWEQDSSFYTLDITFHQFTKRNPGISHWQLETDPAGHSWERREAKEGAQAPRGWETQRASHAGPHSQLGRDSAGSRCFPSPLETGQVGGAGPREDRDA